MIDCEPMETAPKDETELLLLLKSGRSVNARWQPHQRVWVAVPGPFIVWDPVSWAPIPEAKG
jgi:hypothetical protein